MNWILHYTLYVYLLGSTIGDVKRRRQLNFIKGIFDMYDTKIPNTTIYNTKTYNTSQVTESSIDTTRKNDEKEVKRVVVKMLLIATTKHNCNCDCSKNTTTTETSTSKEDNIMNNTLNTIMKKKVLKRNNPEKREVTNNALSNLCPYIVPNEGFKMDKMVDVFWSKFYNMKDPLNCFNINILKLTDMQKKRKEFIYGTFGGKVDWSRCHFEIQPPDSFSDIRHFLLGDASDMGVMRNILIKAESNGEFSLQEETPDQWVMLDKLLMLRDCETGEVVVFSRAPQATPVSDIVLALQNLGEQMIGKMLCDEDDEWSNAML